MKSKENKRYILRALSVFLFMLIPLLSREVGAITIRAEDSQAKTGGAQRIRADQLKWTALSKENPLGGADDFSGLFFDRLVNIEETRGAIAARNFEKIDRVSVKEGNVSGAAYSIPAYNVGIIAQNKIDGQIQVPNGDALIGKSVNKDRISKDSPASIFIQDKEIKQFMSDAKKETEELNKKLWQLSSTSQPTIKGDQIHLQADKAINIFDLDSNQNIRSLNIKLDPNKKNSTIIIKVSANQLNRLDSLINGQKINAGNMSSIHNRIIWVFDPGIRNIDIIKSTIIGSILAPNANINLKAGYSEFNGTVIANSLIADESSRKSAFNYRGLFKGDLAEALEMEEEKKDERTEESPEKTNEKEDEKGKESKDQKTKDRKETKEEKTEIVKESQYPIENRLKRIDEIEVEQKSLKKIDDSGEKPKMTGKPGKMKEEGAGNKGSTKEDGEFFQSEERSRLLGPLGVILLAGSFWLYYLKMNQTE